MKLTKNLHIAKNKISKANTKLEQLEYIKWVEFVEMHHDSFVWDENTEEGQKILSNIDSYPEDFKDRILASLNKKRCFLGFNKKSKLFNVSVTFYEEFNYISIQFVSTPKIAELKTFLEMANCLNALLLNGRTGIIDEKVIEKLEKKEK